ncbi:MAG: MFS transporter, partial [Myxococcota bacterium]
QWTVLFAAWLGWGFDVFDGLLFNFVAPSCVPVLLHLPLGTPEARSATLLWTGVLSATLLLGWAVGGIVFGWIGDRIGRTRTLMITMALYSLGTAACAFAPNIWVLLGCRIVASLGIGGEWAAGAAMVAEVVPNHRRVEAGALLYTSAPLGLFLATQATWLIQGVVLPGSPEWSWRVVFLCGLVPAAVALAVRWFVEEPARWATVAAASAPPRLPELFAPAMVRRTLSGLGMAVVALLMWWACNAFIPVIASGLAEVEAGARGLDPRATTGLKESWKALSTNLFNLGGLIGTLLTVPLSKSIGRRPMFAAYFVGSAFALALAFVAPLPPVGRLYAYFPIGLTVFGVFGSFTYYLPELFPTRLRATGAGFCYNAGRVVAAGGPFLVGWVASRGADALGTAMGVLGWVALVPVVGLGLLPWVVETRDSPLED